MKLIIVESPTKAKTIESFLKGEYKVISSYGHVRDLPKSTMGVDIENNFTPKYIVPKKAREHVKELKSVGAKAHEIVLASDEDREGEAIAWHIKAVLSEDKKANKRLQDSKTYKRIVFHEITKEAIENALLNPREIDFNLVDAQQARRIVDRLVGYELSPFLWKKVRYGLSAGRVQSVTVRLIVEREREIENFKPQEYWTIEGIFKKQDKDQKEFGAKLFSIDSKKINQFDINNQKIAQEIVSTSRVLNYTVEQVTKKQINKYPPSPFTTSTLQQEASRKFGFSAKQTMMVAQKLYENGLITYMRTDSVNLSSWALNQAKKVIGEIYGEKYQLPAPRFFTNKLKGAQEAHEAIRPTDLFKQASAISLKEKNFQKLYELIYKRTIACQMQNAIVEQTSANIASENKKYIYRANGQVVVFDGFIRAYTEGIDENEDDQNTLPPLNENEKVTPIKIDPLQHFTQPPGRYSDATLIKTLESFGVGRPSTYAPTLSTIQERGYVIKEDKKYHPTEIGKQVNDLLISYFPKIIDINFTSKIEEDFDDIAEGKIKWTDVCREFYDPFSQDMEKAKSVLVENKESNVLCPHCQKPMIYKYSRYGEYIICPDESIPTKERVKGQTPEQKAEMKIIEEKTRDEKCQECDKKELLVKSGPFGYYLKCEKCGANNRIWNKIGYKCPACLESEERKNRPGDIVERKGRGRGKAFYGCTKYPKCEFITNKKPESEEEVKELFQIWKNKIAQPKKERRSKK